MEHGMIVEAGPPHQVLPKLSGEAFPEEPEEPEMPPQR